MMSKTEVFVLFLTDASLRIPLDLDLDFRLSILSLFFSLYEPAQDTTILGSRKFYLQNLKQSLTAQK